MAYCRYLIHHPYLLLPIGGPGTIDDVPVNSNVSPNAAGGNSKIPDGSITTSKLADGAVTNSKIAPDAVTTDKIIDGEVNTDDIADNAIIGSKISDGSVNGNHISESFMKKVVLADDFAGHSNGWTLMVYWSFYNI